MKFSIRGGSGIHLEFERPSVNWVLIPALTAATRTMLDCCQPHPQVPLSVNGHSDTVGHPKPFPGSTVKKSSRSPVDL